MPCCLSPTCYFLSGREYMYHNPIPPHAPGPADVSLAFPLVARSGAVVGGRVLVCSLDAGLLEFHNPCVSLCPPFQPRYRAHSSRQGRGCRKTKQKQKTTTTTRRTESANQQVIACCISFVSTDWSETRRLGQQPVGLPRHRTRAHTRPTPTGTTESTVWGGGEGLLVVFCAGLT